MKVGLAISLPRQAYRCFSRFVMGVCAGLSEK